MAVILPVPGPVDDLSRGSRYLSGGLRTGEFRRLHSVQDYMDGMRDEFDQELDGRGKGIVGKIHGIWEKLDGMGNQFDRAAAVGTHGDPADVSR